MAALAEDVVGVRKAKILYGLTGCHLVNDFYSMIFPVFLYSLIRAFGLTNLEAGLITFTTILASAIFQPTVGYYADLYRKRKGALAAGLGLCGVSMALLGLSENYNMVIIAAIVLGVAGSAYHPQSTTMLAYFFPQSRGRASGIHGVGNALGFVIVFVVGGLFIGALGWRQAAYVMVLPGILAALVAWAFFEEPSPTGSRGLLKGVSPSLIVLTLANGLGLMVFMGLISFIPVFFGARGGFPVQMITTLVALMLLPTILAQPLGGALSDRLGRRRMIFLGLVLCGTFVGAFGLYSAWVSWSPLSTALLVFLGAAVFSSNVLISPVAMMFASELAIGERGGTTVGVVWGMGIALSSLAPPMVGYLSDAFGYPLAFLSLVALAGAGALLTLFLPTRSPGARPAATPSAGS